MHVLLQGVPAAYCKCNSLEVSIPGVGNAKDVVHYNKLQTWVKM